MQGKSEELRGLCFPLSIVKVYLIASWHYQVKQRDSGLRKGRIKLGILGDRTWIMHPLLSLEFLYLLYIIPGKKTLAITACSCMCLRFTKSVESYQNKNQRKKWKVGSKYICEASAWQGMLLLDGLGSPFSLLPIPPNPFLFSLIQVWIHFSPPLSDPYSQPSVCSHMSPDTVPKRDQVPRYPKVPVQTTEIWMTIGFTWKPETRNRVKVVYLENHRIN